MASPILVTGASGMVGANLVHRLVGEGMSPHVLVRRGSDLIRLREVMASVVVEIGDLVEADQIAGVVERVRPATVFHLASTFFNPPTLRAADHFQVNLLGTLHLLEALRDIPDVRIVFSGSAGAYDSGRRLREDTPLQPGSFFGCSKAATALLAQTYARRYGLQVVELRLFTPFGPWERPQRLIPSVILAALAGEDIRIGDGGQQRDFTFMADVVDALLLAATHPVATGSIFNICSGEPYRVVDVVETILELMDHPVTVHRGCFPPRPDEIWEISGDNAAAALHLGWRPQISFREGLRRSIAWFSHHRELALRLP